MNEYRRIFATSDTHGLHLFGGVHQWVAETDLSKHDLLLLAGDTELMNQENGSIVLDAFSALPCDCAVIDGNHDDYHAMCERPAICWCGGTAHELAPGIVALRRGEVYTPGGISLWAFGGAMMKGYVPNPDEPQPGELPTAEEYETAWNNLLLRNLHVDMILTHDGPASLVGSRDYDPVRPFLEQVNEQVSFTQWIYGHHHRNQQSTDKILCVFGKIVRLLTSVPDSCE